MKYEFLKDLKDDVRDLQVGAILDTTVDGFDAEFFTAEKLAELVADETIKEVVEVAPEVKEEVEEGANQASGTAVADEVPKKTYNGLEVVSDGVREVNGKEVKHIRTSDGAEFDLTDEEYADQVK